MERHHLTRQSDLIPAAVLGTPITILGAGAIGSFTALALAKMGFGDLTVWDFDRVDDVNVNGQLFGPSHREQFKVVALQNLIAAMSGTEIRSRPLAWIPGCGLGSLVITAVDSMAVRAQVWEQAVAAPHLTKLVIDPRMAIEHVVVHTAEPGDENTRYPNSLFSDAEAVQERCTAKSTAYTSLLAAGLVAQTVKHFLVDGDYAKTTKWSLQVGGQMERWGRDGGRWV